MPAYNVDQFDPPAPVASVILRHPVTGASLSDVPMLIDSGADVTLIPRKLIEKLELTPVTDKVYELQGFDGNTQLADVVQLDLVFLGKRFKGQFLVIDQPLGVLGRNVLNAVAILLNGPQLTWSEQLS
ncbi:MAG: retropepsin-like aspartic protease [Chloroflexota bacterium]